MIFSCAVSVNFLIRYEREEAFMALNLGVTSCQSLEISLDQFVRGEVLEGSNAYYCEKCKEKVLHLPFLKNEINCHLCTLFLCSTWISVQLLLFLPEDVSPLVTCTGKACSNLWLCARYLAVSFSPGGNWALLFSRESQ